MKGIILSGGSGTRLHPITKAVNKQLLPVYDKPMIYYPLSTLIIAGIKDVLIITRPDDAHHYKNLFRDGSQYGISISYASQPEPKGLAQALTIGEEFIGEDDFALILGDNLFFGHGLSEKLIEARKNNKGATVFTTSVEDPERYGILNYDKNETPVSIEEKPEHPKSHWAVTGLYFYKNEAVSIAKTLPPSARGEYEITDVNKHFLDNGKLNAIKLGRGYTWLDMGTHDALLEAGEFVRAIQKRSGTRVGVLEEVSWRQGFLSNKDLSARAFRYGQSSYGQYLRELVSEEIDDTNESIA